MKKIIILILFLSGIVSAQYLMGAYESKLRNQKLNNNDIYDLHCLNFTGGGAICNNTDISFNPLYLEQNITSLWYWNNTIWPNVISNKNNITIINNNLTDIIDYLNKTREWLICPENQYIKGKNSTNISCGLPLTGDGTENIPYWIDTGYITSNQTINKGNVNISGNLTIKNLEFGICFNGTDIFIGNISVNC